MILNRSGNVESAIFFVILLGVLGIAITISVLVVTNFYDIAENQLDTLSKDVVDTGLGGIKIIGNSTIFIAASMVTALFLSAYLIKSHPVFMFATVISAVFGLFIVSPIIANTFINFTDINPDVQTAAATMPDMESIIEDYLPIIALLMFAVIMIGFYAKVQGVGQF